MITLRPYQEDGIQAIYDYFAHNTGNPVLAWPTGTGKSIVPAVFIHRVMQKWPLQRFMMATHVKELIDQNYREVLKAWPSAPIGINSAGLNRRDFIQPIIYGGVKSMYKMAEAFGHRDILFIDEAHLLNPDENSMYQVLIKGLKKVNPRLKVIGMSATPYRIGQGMITDGGLFTDICHDLCSMENFNKLLDDGYLSPLISPSRLETVIDVSNVGISGGEFIQSQLEHEVDRAEITWKGLHEVLQYGSQRRSWLIFASGIKHAEHIAAMLNQLGIDCAAVHSKQSAEYNDAAINAFKTFKLRSIVNYGKLTTGFNHPGIDLIAVFRPTMSVALWVQLLGRGTRPYQENEFGAIDFNTNTPSYIKHNCIVLDFARNITRLGPINDPVIPKKKGDKTGVIPVKICESCGAYNHISSRQCNNCWSPFQFEVKIIANASDQDIIKRSEPVEAPIIEYYDVTHAIYKRGQKEGNKPYLIVSYICGTKIFKEYVFPEGKNRSFFANWWRQRSEIEPVNSVDEVVASHRSLRMPRQIRVHMNRKIGTKTYPEVLGAEF